MLQSVVLLLSIIILACSRRGACRGAVTVTSTAISTSTCAGAGAGAGAGVGAR